MNNKILIADDHTMFADGLISILANEEMMEVVGKTETGNGVFEFLKTQEANLILLDYNLPDMTGSAVAKKLKVEYKREKNKHFGTIAR